ncbi:MAG: hypothetical protein GXP38_16245 [Chloroflexi bacterium]|nr:hypothetical protein [Chloroflexota bacterium]
MRTYVNKKHITRRMTFGRRASFAGLIILMAGMLASFSPGLIAGWIKSGNSLGNTVWAQWLLQGGWLVVSLVCLLIGFLLGQIGNHNIRRFQRSPRPDEVIAKALKGFDDRNHLYAWSTPADLVFVGPAGVYTIITRDLSGQITIQNDRIKQPFSWRRMLFAFGQESPGLPVQEAVETAQKLEAWLNEGSETKLPVEVRPLVVFTNDKAELDIQSASAPVLHYKQLKQYLRNQLRGTSISKDVLKAVIEKLDQEAERRGAVLD